jgi:hypothetical protein
MQQAVSLWTIGLGFGRDQSNGCCNRQDSIRLCIVQFQSAGRASHESTTTEVFFTVAALQSFFRIGSFSVFKA